MSEARWAADPFGRYEKRYWDGEQWSESVANGTRQGLDGELVTLSEQAERLRASSKRALVVVAAGAAMFVVLIVALAMSGSDDPWNGSGGSLAERACGDATSAVREMANGTRAPASAINALSAASEDARDAVVLNRKWQPLARSIVGTQAELAAGHPDVHTTALLRTCGMPDSQ